MSYEQIYDLNFLFLIELVSFTDACCQSTVPGSNSGGVGLQESRAALPPAWSLEGEMLQGSGPPPAPHPGDGLSSSQKSHGHRESQGARRQNNHTTREPLPSCGGRKWVWGGGQSEEWPCSGAGIKSDEV